MTDAITIRGLRVRTRIGVERSERTEPRGLTVNIEIETDTRRAGASDELSDTIDYSKVIADVNELARSAEVKLIEHLAERIAGHFAAMNGVERTIVEVVKDDPPVDQDVQEVSVRIERP